jgi:hypothetical protein
MTEIETLRKELASLRVIVARIAQCIGVNGSDSSRVSIPHDMPYEDIHALAMSEDRGWNAPCAEIVYQLELQQSYPSEQKQEQEEYDKQQPRNDSPYYRPSLRSKSGIRISVHDILREYERDGKWVVEHKSWPGFYPAGVMTCDPARFGESDDVTFTAKNGKRYTDTLEGSTWTEERDAYDRRQRNDQTWDKCVGGL